MATKPIPVRIPAEWLPRIDSVAKRLGTNRARLIAFSGQTFAEYFEKKGVTSMPPDWADILASMDGRRRPRVKGEAAPVKPAVKAGKKPLGRPPGPKAKA
jgi:hypothetical protein